MYNDGLKVLGFRHELELVDLSSGVVIAHEVQLNRIPQAGIDFLIQAPFGGIAPIETLYCGLFRNNFVPNSSTSAADIPSLMGELLDYTETSRPTWTPNYNGAGTLDNLQSKAVFTATAERLVYGAFIASNPVKGSNSGLLLSVARFSTAKALSPGIEARLVCGLTYIPTNVI